MYCKRHKHKHTQHSTLSAVWDDFVVASNIKLYGSRVKRFCPNWTDDRNMWPVGRSLWVFPVGVPSFPLAVLGIYCIFLKFPSVRLFFSKRIYCFYHFLCGKVSHFVRRECAETKWRSGRWHDVWRVSRSESAESHEFCKFHNVSSLFCSLKNLLVQSDRSMFFLTI